MLPRNFSWLRNAKIAGCARPETEDELKALKEQGIRSIISLTGIPLNPEIVSKLGFDYLHSHVSGAPSTEQLLTIMQYIERQNALGKPVLVHCAEGRGRTGTALAAYLVYHGYNAEEAIRVLREQRPGSIETLEQENAVRNFEKDVKRGK